MKPVLRILLLLAALAYGAMPLQGFAAMPGADLAADVPAQPHEQSHEMMSASAGDPCPHATVPVDTYHHPGHMAVTGGHCAACMTLAPMILFADAGLPVRNAETPGLAPPLKSTPSAPLERPPRLHG